MNTTTKNIIEAVAVASLLVVGLGIRARAAEVPQVHVKYGNLNINTPAGAAVLYQRIRLAATQVCGTPDQRDLARLETAKACTDKAIADAVAAVGNDTLMDVYHARVHDAAFVKFAAN